jgi:DNA-binding CsgD family transcriptional regulator
MPALLITGYWSEDRVANRALMLHAQYAEKPLEPGVLEKWLHDACTQSADALGSGREDLQRRVASDSEELRGEVLETWRQRYDLTVRECEMLDRARAGKPRVQLAQDMACSVATLGHHVHNLLGKTGDRWFFEAVARYWEEIARLTAQKTRS